MIHLIAQDLAAGTLPLASVVFLTAALAWFVFCGIVLWIVDVREHRLPNAWTGLLFVGGSLLLIATTLAAPDESVLTNRVVTTLIGSMGYLSVMFVLHLVTRAGLGMGDVKLAAGLGLYTGFIGLEALIAGVVLAFVFGGLQAVYLVLFRGGKRSTKIAFGPAMLAACLGVLIM